MFEALTGRLEGIFQKLRGRGLLTEENIREGLREVRLALLEADVHFTVVKQFVERVRERAVGQEVLKSLTPGQQVVKIVHEELIGLLGVNHVPLAFAQQPPTLIFLVGLQGSGKTTTAGKLALWCREKGRSPLLVAADVQRPAAAAQLATLGEQLKVPVLTPKPGAKPVEIAREGLSRARKQAHDVVLVDTAGRLHIDPDLMAELKEMAAALRPHEVLLVADAMTGQDAVNSATAFHGGVGLTGIILTKMDGDARGGAALSIRAVTGQAIKFIGVGEKLDRLEAFHPERIASRILGMGDVLSLVEKAQQAVELENAERLARRIREDKFTLDDFRLQLQQVKRMGSLEQIMEMIPGFKKLKGVQPDERELVKVQAIIDSMTAEERRDIAVINSSRKRRIAMGSGTQAHDVNRLLKQFTETKRLMRQISRAGPQGLGKMFPGLRGS
ncbi:MAG: signal recognition particle protein [Candidatus Tectomicrobia bacterium]|uniref:Signal recognition particle protein n=1 Tax=Tectimicrobiota bacterium TaxID=2528274 RepID=A0A932GMD7_UNCTE|nr:signal recognition particle protein [Candidatus Tectomicrobia bacterium]